MQRKHSSLSLALIGLLVLTACAPSQAPGTAGGPAVGEAPQREKVLNVILQRPIQPFDDIVAGTSGSAAWRHWVEFAYEDLTAPSKIPGGPREMRLARELPTQANGGWVIKPDGTMDMTWKIVPNAKWHDGTPLTAADIEFSVRIRNDPEVGRQAPDGGAQYIKSMTIVDPYTIIAHWGQLSILGQYGEGLAPLAKHILEPVYLQDKSQLQFHNYLTVAFIGAGPFRLTHYEPASHLEFQRFEDYYKGPVKIHKVVLRTVPDANTMAANFLAGAADVVLPPGIGMELAAEFRERFQQDGSRHQVIIGERTSPNNYELMVDPVYARPVNGMTQTKVRQAGLHAINRDQLTEVMTFGQVAVARQQYHPESEGYRHLKDYIESPRFPWNYPYDVRRAAQLFAEAGWTKGPDGILVHSPSGERFTYQVLIRQGGDWLKLNSLIQQDLKAAGIDLEIHTLTTSEQNDNKFIATKPGAANVTAGITGRRLHSANLATEANNWTGGNNRGRWNEPAMDRLIERVEVAVRDEDARVAYREYLDASMGVAANWPFYWEPIPWLAAKGVTGIIPYGSNQEWWWEVDKN